MSSAEPSAAVDYSTLSAADDPMLGPREREKALKTRQRCERELEGGARRNTFEIKAPSKDQTGDWRAICRCGKDWEAGTHPYFLNNFYQKLPKRPPIARLCHWHLGCPIRCRWPMTSSAFQRMQESTILENSSRCYPFRTNHDSCRVLP